MLFSLSKKHFIVFFFPVKASLKLRTFIDSYYLYFVFGSYRYLLDNQLLANYGTVYFKTDPVHIHPIILKIIVSKIICTAGICNAN